MSYFNYENKQIYFNELGSGKTIILLHGNTASSAMFNGIAEEFAQHYHVVLIDFLGHGKSDRLQEFPTDLWFEEAKQTIALIESQGYKHVNLIGCSGGAQVAINVALEAPHLIDKVIADSFEGKKPIQEFTENLALDRERSKQDADSIAFYQAMHKENWMQVVDLDTQAIVRHAKTIGRFFHQELGVLQADILLTGSLQDEFIQLISPHYFEECYRDMLQEIGHGKMFLFEKGNHPAMLSNAERFIEISQQFLG